MVLDKSTQGSVSCQFIVTRRDEGGWKKKKKKAKEIGYPIDFLIVYCIGLLNNTTILWFIHILLY